MRILKEALLRALTGRSWAHLWYLYVLLALYLLLPLFRAFYAHTPPFLQVLVLCALFALSSVLPYYAQMRTLTPQSAPLAPLIHVFYYLSGFFVFSRRRFLKEGRLVLSVLAAGAAGVICLHGLVLSQVHTGYNAPAVAVMALAVFAFFCTDERPHPAASGLAPCIFGMYLTHTAPLNLLYKGMHITPLLWGGILPVPLFAASAGLFSYCCTKLMRRSRLLREYVL